MDKMYWEKYYLLHKQDGQAKKPSCFSKFVLSRFLRGKDRILHLLELGCGNGRDCLYFAKEGIKVTAIDQASDEIACLRDSTKVDSVEFLSGDFTKLESFGFLKFSFDCIYSRFTLHCITKQEQDRVIYDALGLLKKDGILAIEARGERNALFAKGMHVESNAYIYDNHYRRFLNFQDTIDELQNISMGGGATKSLISAMMRICKMHILRFYTQKRTKTSLHTTSKTIISYESSQKRRLYSSTTLGGVA